MSLNDQILVIILAALLKWSGKSAEKLLKKERRKKSFKEKEKTCQKSLILEHIIVFQGHYYKWDQK